MNKPFPFHNVRVVIAEDEGLTQLQLKKMMKIFGGEVVAVVSGGTDAVEAVISLKPDLVLMDVQMDNHIDGIEAARRILAEMSVCIILMTAYEEFREQATEVGVAGYLIKPLCVDELEIELPKLYRAFKVREEEDKESVSFFDKITA